MQLDKEEVESPCKEPNQINYSDENSNKMATICNSNYSSSH